MIERSFVSFRTQWVLEKSRPRKRARRLSFSDHPIHRRTGCSVVVYVEPFCIFMRKKQLAFKTKKCNFFSVYSKKVVRVNMFVARQLRITLYVVVQGVELLLILEFYAYNFFGEKLSTFMKERSFVSFRT